MNLEQFWKVAYLYAIKNNYDILYYKRDKNDIWFIDENNEITRLIYTEKLKLAEVDSSVYNIINNESRLKKVFKLSSLKIKILHISEDRDVNIQEYKKYKISDQLSIERIVITDANKSNFFKDKDIKFIDYSIYNEKFKNRIENKYIKAENPYNVNFRFMSIFLVFIFLFFSNYVFLYFSNKSIYEYLEYNYQSILMGDLYRLISDVFVFSNVNELVLVSLTGILISILFSDSVKTVNTILIMGILTFFFSVLRLFKYVSDISVVSLAVFSILATIIANQYIDKSSNKSIIYACGVSVIYFFISFFTLTSKKTIIFYVGVFILGIILNFIVSRNILKWTTSIVLISIILVSVLIRGFAIDIKTPINNYYYNKLENSILVENQSRIDELEKEKNSKNKSVLTYYELANLNMLSISKEKAKEIYLEAISFDNTFAPVYYELALIEYSSRSPEKAKEYINRAIELDNNPKYVTFRDGL